MARGCRPLLTQGWVKGTQGVRETLKYSQGLRNGRALKMARPAVVCLLSAMLAMAACNGSEDTTTPAVAVEWGYEGPGAPESWASLSEEYADCADGEQQSPVDIAGYVEGDAAPASFSYGSDATAVRNDGKFVHVDYAPGSAFSLGQRSFELKSAHLHAPSEHRIDGASFAAELHLVHADAEDRLTVAALLFRLGDPSPIAQAILDAAPAAGSTAQGGRDLNAALYAPVGPDYYRYDGSKTTPPCHEPVEWYVMREQRTISQEQVNSLMSLSGGPNSRPVRPTGSRVITTGGAP